jgi:tetratricopeptide (TPR) repeat protein
VACYRYIAGLPRLEKHIPLWAKRKGSASFLKQLKARCDKEPTNTELAGEAGVANVKTLTAWFRGGKRLSPEHMKLLAEAFVRRLPGTEYDTLLAEMTRHYAFAELCDRLAGMVGGRYCMELVEALYDQINRIMESLERDNLPAEQRSLHWFLQLIHGASMSHQALWLKYLWDTEEDMEWKRDMVCVEMDWVSRIFQMNLRFTDEGVLERRKGTNYLYVNPYDVPPDGGYYGALLHRDDPDGISAGFDYVSASYIDNQIDGEMALWGGAGPEAYDWDEKTESQFRLAIESNPNNARAHLDLGIFLGLHGYLPTHLEEGYRECIKAIELQPKWELPWIETANILLHAGYTERGLQVLQDAATKISRPSLRMVYTIGFARMMNRDFGDALAMFEKAGRMKSDFAPAFENAAFCAFRLGDKLRGKRYAKVARQLGISTTYDLYDVGKTKQKPNAVPFEILCETVLCPDKNCKGRAESEKLRQDLQQKYPEGAKFSSRFQVSP